MNVLAGKLAVSLSLLLLLAFVNRPNVLDRLSSSQFFWLSWAILALIRITAFILIFVVIGLAAQSDVVVYYREAKSALSGALIYRDFPSSYGPLFTYLEAGAVFLWDSPKSLVLLAIIVELGSFPLWLRIADRAFSDRIVRKSTLLYVFSPVPFFVVGVSGQNQCFGSAFLAMCICLLFQDRNALAGFVAGVSIPGVKFLTLLFAPVLWAFSHRRISFAAAFMVAPVIVYGWLLIADVDILVPLYLQLNDRSPGNLPFLFSLIGLETKTISQGRLWDAFLVISLAGVFIFHFVRSKLRKHSCLIYFVTLIGLTFMICSKKSYANYLVFFYFPFCILVANLGFSWKSTAMFSAINLAASLEPSLYFRWFRNVPVSNASLALPLGVSVSPIVGMVSFIVCELVLMSCYLWYFWKAWIQTSTSTANIRTFGKNDILVRNAGC